VGCLLCSDLEEELGKTFSALGPIQDFRTVRFRSRHLRIAWRCVATVGGLSRSFLLHYLGALVHLDAPSSPLVAGAVALCD
jgi:hypothetical protein